MWKERKKLLKNYMKHFCVEIISYQLDKHRMPTWKAKRNVDKKACDTKRHVQQKKHVIHKRHVNQKKHVIQYDMFIKNMWYINDMLRKNHVIHKRHVDKQHVDKKSMWYKTTCWQKSMFFRTMKNFRSWIFFQLELTLWKTGYTYSELHNSIHNMIFHIWSFNAMIDFLTIFLSKQLPILNYLHKNCIGS